MSNYLLHRRKDFRAVGGGQSFSEAWSAVGVQSGLQQGDPIASTDEGNWGVIAGSDHANLDVITENGLVTITNDLGAGGVAVGIEQDGLSTTKLNSTYPQCLIDFQMESGGGSSFIYFLSGASAVASIEIQTDSDVIDNKSNSYNFPGTDVYTDRLDYEFEFNFTANTWTMTIGGAAVFSGIAFDNNVNSIDTVQITRETNQYGYVRGMSCGSAEF